MTQCASGPRLIMLLARILLNLLNIFKDNYFSPRPLVHVPGVGSIRGSTVRSVNRRREIHGYWGIPYGLPASGERRFLPPSPAPPLEGEFDAGQLRYVLSPRTCPQVRPAAADSPVTLVLARVYPHTDGQDGSARLQEGKERYCSG